VKQFKIGHWLITHTGTRILATTRGGTTYKVRYRHTVKRKEDPAEWRDFADHYLGVRTANETLEQTIERLAFEGRLGAFR